MTSNTSQSKALSILHRARIADYATWSLILTCRPCDALREVALATLPPELTILQALMRMRCRTLGLRRVRLERVCRMLAAIRMAAEDSHGPLRKSFGGARRCADNITSCQRCGRVPRWRFTYVPKRKGRLPACNGCRPLILVRG